MLKYAPRNMNKAPTNSLEYYLNTLTDCSIYFPLTSPFNRLMLTQYMGFYNIPHKFFPTNLYQKSNGVFFVKHADQNNVPAIELSHEESPKQRMEKVKRRKEILKELESQLNMNSSVNSSQQVTHKKKLLGGNEVNISFKQKF